MNCCLRKNNTPDLLHEVVYHFKDLRVYVFRYMHFIIKSRLAEEKIIHAVSVKGHSRASGQLPFTEENICFPDQGYEINSGKEKSKSWFSLQDFSYFIKLWHFQGKSTLLHCHLCLKKVCVSSLIQVYFSILFCKCNHVANQMEGFYLLVSIKTVACYMFKQRY